MAEEDNSKAKEDNSKAKESKGQAFKRFKGLTF